MQYKTPSDFAGPGKCFRIMFCKNKHSDHVMSVPVCMSSDAIRIFGSDCTSDLTVKKKKRDFTWLFGKPCFVQQLNHRWLAALSPDSLCAGMSGDLHTSRANIETAVKGVSLAPFDWCCGCINTGQRCRAVLLLVTDTTC